MLAAWRRIIKFELLGAVTLQPLFFYVSKAVFVIEKRMNCLYEGQFGLFFS